MFWDLYLCPLYSTSRTQKLYNTVWVSIKQKNKDGQKNQWHRKKKTYMLRKSNYTICKEIEKKKLDFGLPSSDLSPFSIFLLFLAHNACVLSWISSYIKETQLLVMMHEQPSGQKIWHLNVYINLSRWTIAITWRPSSAVCRL